jgi:hypothetical protein
MQAVQYAVQYSAGLLCADSLLLMSLDAAGTNDKHTAGCNQPTKELTKGGDFREAQVDVHLSSHSCVLTNRWTL